MTTIGNFEAEQLCQEFGTPLYAYDAAVIRKNAQRLKAAIGVYEHAEFLYAIKANYNPSIVKLIAAEGFGIDAVSLEEVRMGLHCGIPAEQIMFTGNNMRDDEMEECHRLGVLLNIGSLSRLKKFGEAFPGSKVCVRFNPNVGAASHASNITGGPSSKFGISYKKLSDVLEIVDAHELKLVGIHEHIGSGWLGLEEPIMAMNVLLELAAQIPSLEFIDLGGGFGVPYKPGQEQLDLEALGQAYKKGFEAFNQAHDRTLKMRIEPGRFLVAESGHLLTRVNTIKQGEHGRPFVGTDTGMSQLVRPSMYGSYHPIRNLSNPGGETHSYDIVGNICESADFFAKERDLPEVREGDILSIDMAGAYGFCMASNYQFRALPAEIMVDGDTKSIIRKRSTFNEMIQNYEA